MNLFILFLAVVVLLIDKNYAVPIDTPEFYAVTDELTTTLTTTETATTTTETTTTTITTTTTTTTLAPEVDREWEDLVLAGPTVVNYLSLFMVLASRQEQALTPPEGYQVKYIKSVESLRVTLSQIVLAMQSAFQVARTDLIRTRVSMDQIPDHLKAGLLLIKTAPTDLLKQLLPYTLRNVDRAANEGSAVAKPTLASFVSVGLLLEELVKLLGSTVAVPEVPGSAEYIQEARAYAADIKAQWDLLVKLFTKFSERADITQQGISSNFINPIEDAQKTNEFNSTVQRSGHLDKLIPATIAIDQSSNLLNMMVLTYNDVSSDHMTNQIASSNNYIAAPDESNRAIHQRTLWQQTVKQSVKVARLAQERHNQFVETNPNRQETYAAYLQSVLAS